MFIGCVLCVRHMLSAGNIKMINTRALDKTWECALERPGVL